MADHDAQDKVSAQVKWFQKNPEAIAELIAGNKGLMDWIERQRNSDDSGDPAFDFGYRCAVERVADFLGMEKQDPRPKGWRPPTWSEI